MHTHQNMKKLKLSTLIIFDRIYKKNTFTISGKKKNWSSLKRKLPTINENSVLCAKINLIIVGMLGLHSLWNIFVINQRCVYACLQYKYQISIDGTVAAYRLPYLLGGSGVVLKQDSPYYEFFYHDLEPFVHYIPFKRDLSDLIEKVSQCRAPEFDMLS